MIKGKAPQGIFSLARGGDIIVAVGGDYEQPDQGSVGGVFDRSWKNMATRQDVPDGYRSAVAQSNLELIALGPTGTGVSRDGRGLASRGKHSAECSGVC